MFLTEFFIMKFLLLFLVTVCPCFAVKWDETFNIMRVSKDDIATPMSENKVVVRSLVECARQCIGGTYLSTFYLEEENECLLNNYTVLFKFQLVNTSLTPVTVLIPLKQVRIY